MQLQQNFSFLIKFIYSYIINQIGGLMLKDDHISGFAQIYFHDTDLNKQFQIRHDIFFHFES